MGRQVPVSSLDRELQSHGPYFVNCIVILNECYINSFTNLKLGHVAVPTRLNRDAGHLPQNQDGIDKLRTSGNPTSKVSLGQAPSL